MRYDKHIFICANQKAEGKTCCGEARGMELVNKFKEVLREKGLQGKIRAQRSGCLDACSNGPTLVIYPEGTYYGHVTLNDVERIIDGHILNNQTLTDLELTF
ncbi:MAG: (2Fe-2S) ferredoxin domain-containing protein [Bacteroidia bacterium]|nr:(2Fe-2S) ferredoxin domain-containing protein [Bacteroidia bacterium]